MTGGLVRPSSRPEPHLFLDRNGAVRSALVGRRECECHVHYSCQVPAVGSRYSRLYELGPGLSAVRPVVVGFVGLRSQGVGEINPGVGENPFPEVLVEVVEARLRCSQEVVVGLECRLVRPESLAQEHPGKVVVWKDTHAAGD